MSLLSSLNRLQQLIPQNIRRLDVSPDLAAARFYIDSATASAQKVGDWAATVGIFHIRSQLRGCLTTRPNMHFRGAVIGGPNYIGTEKEANSTFEVDANFSAFSGMADDCPT